MHENNINIICLSALGSRSKAHCTEASVATYSAPNLASPPQVYPVIPFLCKAHSIDISCVLRILYSHMRLKRWSCRVFQASL